MGEVWGLESANTHGGALGVPLGRDLCIPGPGPPTDKESVAQGMGTDGFPLPLIKPEVHGGV